MNFTNYIDQFNATSLRIKPRQTHIDKIVIYSILFLLSSIGNTTSFIALLNMKKRKNFNQSKYRIRLLFLNLCIGDLMVTFIHMPLEIAWAYTDSWLAGDVVCKLMLSLRTFGFYLSSSVLIAITIDRYYAVINPMEIDKINTLTKRLLYFCWIFSFVSSIPQVSGLNFELC